MGTLVALPTAPPAAAELMTLSPDLIDVGENVRIQPGELEDLAASIQAHGILQPVRAIGPDPDGRYRLVWGQRRLLAARMVGLTGIPTIVESSADVDEPGPRRATEQLVENIQRADLNPIDEARALRAVLDGETGLTQAELAKRLGRSPSWIANALRLLDTAPVVQDALAAGTISAGHGKALAVLAHDDQVELLEKAAKQGWSSHELERQVKWAKEQEKTNAARRENARAGAIKVLEALAKVVRKDTPIVVHDDTTGDELRKAGYDVPGRAAAGPGLVDVLVVAVAEGRADVGVDAGRPHRGIDGTAARLPADVAALIQGNRTNARPPTQRGFTRTPEQRERMRQAQLASYARRRGQATA